MYDTKEGRQLGLNTVCGSHSHSVLPATQTLEMPVTFDMMIVPLTLTSVP